MKKTFTFAALPDSAEALSALPEFAGTDPFMTAALTVLALSRYSENVDDCVEMMNLLRGPRPLSPFDLQFLRDRLTGKPYKVRSFFAGAVPGNDYTPDVPFTVTVEDNPYSYQNDGYATLYLRSGGADNPRPVTLRRRGDGKWLLWELVLLADVRVPKSEDPWA